MKKRHKYRAVATTYNGITYPSKAEAAYAAYLDTMLRAKQIAGWSRNTAPIALPGDIAYVPDFLVVPNSGAPYYVDVKGVETAVFRLKMRLYKSMPVTSSGPAIHVVRRSGTRWSTSRIITCGVEAARRKRETPNV